MPERQEKFTPGPWTFVKNSARCEVDTGCGYSFAFSHKSEADAHLIAAAPEMYAELKDLLDAMEAGLFPQAAPGVDYPAVFDKKQELRNLLQKARGEA